MHQSLQQLIPIQFIQELISLIGIRRVFTLIQDVRPSWMNWEAHSLSFTGYGLKPHYWSIIIFPYFLSYILILCFFPLFLWKRAFQKFNILSVQCEILYLTSGMVTMIHAELQRIIKFLWTLFYFEYKI